MPSVSSASLTSTTAPAPAPGEPALLAPLSPAVRRGPILQLSGHVALDADGTVHGRTVAEQTAFVLDQITAQLSAHGGAWADVTMVRVCLTDTAHFAEMNSVYAASVPQPFPARTTTYGPLPGDFLVEIDVMAVPAETGSPAEQPA
ncbi:RidA family protein [Streptomyces sp. NPDC094143]|uniref:RidA family protein n=1 Tax=Streptomyces sp. NPDC094143 TaxID=3155310 RepID=UPI00331AE91C